MTPRLIDAPNSNDSDVFADAPDHGTVTTRHATHPVLVTHTRTAKKGAVTVAHSGTVDDLCLAAHDLLARHDLPVDGWDNPTFASLVRLADTRPDLTFRAGQNGSTLAAVSAASQYHSTPSSAVWRAHGFLTELRQSPVMPWGITHAEPWDRAGFAPETAARWRDNGFAAFTAGLWAEAGFGYKTAAIWHSYGMTARAVAAGYRRARASAKHTPRPDPALIADLWEPVQAMAVFTGTRARADDVVAQVMSITTSGPSDWTSAA